MPSHTAPQSRRPDRPRRLIACFFFIEQEAVRACVARKYPDRSVEVSIPKSPDLAIVEGAAHFVSAPPASGGVGPGGQQLPAAPRFAAVTSANSYGIVVSEVGRGREGRGTVLFFRPVGTPKPCVSSRIEVIYLSCRCRHWCPSSAGCRVSCNTAVFEGRDGGDRGLFGRYRLQAIDAGMFLPGEGGGR